MSDEEYTIAVDEGLYTNFVRDRYGYGLAQWTYWSRKESLYKFCKERGVSVGNLNAQLEFLVWELKGYRDAYEKLLQAKSVREASDVVLLGYEKPADQSVENCGRRASYGQGYYDKHCNDIVPEKDDPSTPAEDFKPFLVRVRIANLYIRAGAGTNTKKLGFITKGVYTIVEVKEGIGAKAGWGRLKSGRGWICLDYVEKA